MGKQRKLKIIRKAAKDLPVIMRNTIEKHFVTGAELRLLDEMDDRAKDGCIENLIDDRMYVRNFPVQIAINHERNLKKLVMAHGPEIIGQYRDAVIQQSNQ